MTNNTGKQGGIARLRHALLGSTLVLLGLASAGCGGGGGGSSGSAVRLTSISPATGPFIGGTTVTLHGSKFVDPNGAPNVVKIGGQLCTNVVTLDDGTITCETPAGTPGMLVDVSVSAGVASASLNDGFRYFDAIPVRSDLNGDGVADLVIAAPLDDASGVDAGAVLVFFGSDDASALVDRSAATADVRILAQHAGDDFGACICTGDVDGDGQDDLVVGANLVDSGAVGDAGAVYVFYGPLAGGSTIPALAADVRLLGETTIAGDRFGSLVDLGDLDGDGTMDICAAAPRHDHGNPATNPAVLDTGCVYVFRGGASLASRNASDAQHKLDGVARNDRLGASLAVGDIDDDGVVELAVGCPQHDPSRPVLLQNAGVVYVLHSAAGMQLGAIETAPMLLTGEQPEDQFGSVVTMGDVDGDGVTDLLVSAPLNDYYEPEGGRVYVFKGGPGLASREAGLADVKLSGMATHNSFGQALRVTDLDGDNVFDLLIGAPHADHLNDGNGRAYLFYGGPALVDTVAVEADAMFNGENSQDDQLGTALSVVDINADHIADLVMSAARNTFGAGRVYLFLSPAHGHHLAIHADVQYFGTQAEALFGAAVAEGQ